MKIRLAIVLTLLCSISIAQDKDTSDRYVKMNEVVVSANKFEENKRNVIQKIDVITARTIARTNAQNTGDLLLNTGSVFVQKSQQGGSSPVIRGFEASRVLLVIDGVRMNNLIYRSGHLQNVITVDQNMLDRVEIMHGPSSTLFGSDALGGAVHLMTKKPVLSTRGDSISGNTFMRYSTVNNERTAHMNVNVGGKKWAFLTSLTYSDFGDMKMGRNDPKNYPHFGKRFQYIQPIGPYAQDTVLMNSDSRIQRFSGYKQWDLMQKILFQPSRKTTHSLNLQLSNTSNVPRYDRMQDIRNGTLRFAEWYYGPQKRSLVAYSFEKREMKGFFDQLKATLSYQDVLETRHTREYRRYDRLDNRREYVQVWGAIVDLHKAFGKHELIIGLDAQWNDLKSRADRRSLFSSTQVKLDTRYPDGKNKMNNLGIYAQHIYKFNNRKWVLNDGIRLQTVALASEINDNSFFNLPVTSVRQQHAAVTGNAGLAFIPSTKHKLSIGFSSGFRAPNIDDLSKIFESSTAARQVVIPNSNVKPEYTYNIDLSYKRTIANKITAELTGYYTTFRNAIIKAPFQLNGQDSILYYGVKAQVLASQNRNRATLYGAQITIAGDLDQHWSFLTTLSYTYGMYETDPSEKVSIYVRQSNGTYALTPTNTNRKPLDHIPPIFGKTSVQYRWGKGYVEFFSLYNGFKRLHLYNPDGEDNAQYATPDGMPGWFTLNVRAGLQLNQRFMLQSALENIADRNHRYFASGFSAPGRNLLITIRYRF